MKLHYGALKKIKQSFTSLIPVDSLEYFVKGRFFAPAHFQQGLGLLLDILPFII